VETTGIAYHLLRVGAWAAAIWIVIGCAYLAMKWFTAGDDEDDNEDTCDNSHGSESTSIHDAHLTTDGEIDNRNSSKK